MNERNPRFTRFSATVAGKKVSWSSNEQHLTGDQELIDLIQKELSVELGYKVTATGPFVYSDLRKAAPVYLALLAMFGETVIFKNPPNLDRLWSEPWMLDEGGKFIPGLVF